MSERVLTAEEFLHKLAGFVDGSDEDGGAYLSNTLPLIAKRDRAQRLAGARKALRWGGANTAFGPDGNMLKRAAALPDAELSALLEPKP